MIPRCLLGKTGVEVTRIGLGGEGVLRTWGREREARAVIHKALELGINYFESARAYSGSESYYGLSLGERRKEIFLASKSHERTAAGARGHLETTLKNLQTDWLDLWQVHDVRTEQDLQEIFGPGGAIEAFEQARREGKVRFIGLTGHQNPQVLIKAMNLFPFDTVLLPVNPAEPAFQSFIDSVLPEAGRRQMGVVGMKVLCRGLALQMPDYQEVQPWIRFALSQQVSTVVIGCETPEQVEQNLAAACSELPMDSDEQQRLIKKVAPVARRLMYYK